MELSVDELTAWVGDFFWPFIRLSALFMASPIFGARTVPVRIRIILAVAVTVLIQPSLPYINAVSPLSAAGLIIIFQQVGIGVIMGMILQIIFASLVMAGQVIATSMGLGFASAIDPQNGVQVTMLGQFYLIIATIFFLMMDGHLLVIQVLADSFVAIPILNNSFSIDFFWNVSAFTAQIFVAALLVSLPVMVGVLLVNLGFGVITRAAPQLNIFALGFPITMTAGFLLMLMSLPTIFPLLSDIFTESFDFMIYLVN